MDTNNPTSLQHSTLFVISLKMCNVPEIYALIKELDYNLHKNDLGKWEILSGKATRIISAFGIVQELEEKILAVLRAITIEISKWRYDHWKILSPEINLSIVCWKSEGIIDRLSTAISIINCTDLDIKKKFVLACYYSLENCILGLWDTMSSVNQDLVYENYYSGIVRFWILNKYRKTINWSKLARLYLNPLCLSNSTNYHDDSIWLRGFFDKLSPEEQLNCLSFTLQNTFEEHDNVHFSLSKININQHQEIFKNNPYQILRLYLNWPLQSSFIKVANQLWAYLPEEQFCSLLYFILFYRITCKWNDYDYIGLLRQFWQQSPDNFKEYAKEKTIFEAIKVVTKLHLIPIPKDVLEQKILETFLL
ncbi:hypothetical protein CEXT_632652, partial [Caerostris extrusa]